jgi:HSP20 family molecular chaperone IbpA
MVTKKIPISSFFMDDDDFTLTPHDTGLSVFEEGDSIVIEAAVPGFSIEGVEVTHAPGYLLIEAEQEEATQKRKYYRKACGSFSYRVPLPPTADLTTDPEATLKDGIMKIVFKKVSRKRKSIFVKKGS